MPATTPLTVLIPCPDGSAVCGDERGRLVRLPLLAVLGDDDAPAVFSARLRVARARGPVFDLIAWRKSTRAAPVATDMTTALPLARHEVDGHAVVCAFHAPLMLWVVGD